MANEEVLGPRKTMFVLVIVVGCFAVLWPRILSPLILGHQRDQLKPNQFDREAGCCEMIFESEVAVLELLNEVCNSIAHSSGQMSPYAAAECRKAVNETCGVDIQQFLKRSDNVGKTTKALLDMMKAGNSSCLKEHFGVPIWSFSSHPALNSWAFNYTSVKQERPVPRPMAGAHPALAERGRAIPPAPRPATLPPHVRVWDKSPLAGYVYLDIKPPPIPGMRPPLGSPGGPVQPPKSSMGFVMPIYTICIIVFFVYTLSKILFKRTAGPYDQVTPDPQFRRRVFRDDSRASPDKLVVTAISGLVAEVQQQMEASYARNQQTQETQDDGARPYTNGRIIHSGPVQIIASEYRTPEIRTTEPSFVIENPVQTEKELTKEDWSTENVTEESKPYEREHSPVKETTPEPKELPKPKEISPEPKELSPEAREISPEAEDLVEEDEELDPTEALIKLAKKVEEKTDNIAKMTGDFLREEAEKARLSTEKSIEEKFADLLEEAMKEESPDKEEKDEVENTSVKVLGMETRAHAADGRAWPAAEPPAAPLPPPAQPPPPPAHEAQDVKSIYLETEIPTQSRVLITEFAADRADNPPTAKHSSLVVSGKMTLSLIQDDPRDTPERETESTFDDFTTASAFTQPAAQKEDDLSDEDVDDVEEIEVEEVDEEAEEVEDDEEVEGEEGEEVEVEEEGQEESGDEEGGDEEGGDEESGDEEGEEMEVEEGEEDEDEEKPKKREAEK